MTQKTVTETTPRLWKDSAFIEDAWRHAETDDGEGHVILPLAAWLGLGPDQRKAGSNRLGVLLAPGDKLEHNRCRSCPPSARCPVVSRLQ